MVGVGRTATTLARAKELGIIDVASTSAAEAVQDADLVLIAPATATTIAKLAHGIADNILTCTVLATRAPVIVSPAMNDNMYTHPVTQKNIAQLKALGYHFVDPVEGNLACDRVGVGHIASDESMLASVTNILSSKSRRG